MCLTIPKQVISKNKNSVTLKDEIENEIEKSVISTINVKRGDWVLTQKIVRHGSLQDVIIKKITAKQAKEILKIINSHSLQT
jgi:hydrogenase maturation factor